jgi:thioesterase domain-containing protein
VEPKELERYLNDHIPLSAAMGVEVLEASAQGVLLAAPLAPNINHRDTVFGGSASALAILAGWSLVHLRLASAETNYRIVIQRNTVEYTSAMPGRFSARAELAEPDGWDRFMLMLRSKGRARIRVRAVLESGGVEAGSFEGVFVAIDLAR